MEIDEVKHIDQTLINQHDWHLALKEPISSFFLGIKPKSTERTIFYDVQVTKLIDEYGFTVLPSKDGNNSLAENIEQISLDVEKNLHVTYLNKITIFVSPVAELRIGGLETAPHTFDVSSSGQTFVSADTSGNLVVSSAMDGSTMRILKGHAMDVYKCLYFPSGVVVLSAGMDLTIRIWAIDTGECVRVLKGHTQSVTGIGIIDVGKEIVSCSNDGSAIKWNCGSGEHVQKWNFEAGKCVDLTIFGNTFAVVSEFNLLSVVRHNETSKREDIKLPSEPTCVCFLIREGDNEVDLVCVGFEDGHIAAYSMNEKQWIGEIWSNRGRVKCIKNFHSRIIVAYNDGTIAAYKIPMETTSNETQTTVPVFSEYELTGADCDPIDALSIHGRTLYTCCRDRIVRKYKLLWNS